MNKKNNSLTIYLLLLQICFSISSLEAAQPKLVSTKIMAEKALDLFKAKLKTQSATSNPQIVTQADQFINSLLKGIPTFPETYSEVFCTNLADAAWRNLFLNHQLESALKDLANARKAINIDVKTQSPSLPAADLIAVPDALKNKVWHLRVDQQGSNECGFRVVYNAKAIADLLTENKPITSEAINKKAAEYAKTCVLEQREIYPDLIVRLLDMVAIPKPVILIKTKENGSAGILTTYPQKEYVFQDTVVPSLTNLSSNDYAFFIINKGTHFVLATLIKKPGAMPYILYTDSLNTPLKTDADAYKNLVKLSNIQEFAKPFITDATYLKYRANLNKLAAKK